MQGLYIMWEEAQIKANVGLKHWSRLWLTQNKYINHWKPLRLSLDPSWSASLWMQGCARRPCALSGALCESTSNKNSLIVRFSRDWTIPLWRTYFQADWMHVCQTELFSWHFRDVRFSPSSDTVCLSSRQWLYVYTCPLEKTALLFSALMNVGSNKHPLTEEA